MIYGDDNDQYFSIFKKVWAEAYALRMSNF